MASLGSLVVRVGANIADFQSDMGRAATISKKRGRDIKRSLDGAVNSLGSALGTGLGIAGFITIMSKASRASLAFGESMAEVSTLLDKDTLPTMKSMTQATKDLSIQFGSSPITQAKALYQAISGGATAGAEATNLLTQANKLAVAGVTDVKTAVDALIIVTNAYGSSAGTAANISDVLFSAVKAGRTTIDEMSQGIGTVATIAGQMGISFEETAAAVATFTKAGVNTSEAMTALRGVLIAVAKPADKAVKTAKELGLEFNATALASKGLTGFLGDVKAATGGNIEVMSKLFGRVEGLGLVMNLTGKGADDFSSILRQMATSAGITDEAYAKMSDTFAVRTRRFKAIIEVAFISIGDKILKVLVPAMEFLVENAAILGQSLAALAVIMTTKLVVGFVLATRQSILYQLTLARMAGTSAIAAVGTSALSGAMGVLRGALALVGGPIGLIVIGLAGLVVWAKNAGDKLIDLSTSAVTASKSLDDITQSLAAVSTIQGAVAQLDALRNQWFENTKAIKQAKVVLKQFSDVGVTTGDKVDKLRKTISDLEGNTSDVKDQMIVARDKILGFEKATKEAEAQAKKLAKEQNVVAASSKKLAAQQEIDAETAIFMSEVAANLTQKLEDEKNAADKLTSTFDNMSNRLDPLIQKNAQFSDEINVLIKMLKDGKISRAEYDGWLVKLIDEYEGAGTAATDMADETGTAMIGMSAIVENTFKRLDDTFASFWQNMLKDGKFSLKGIKDLFLDTIAQMLHAALTKPIVMKIGAAFTGILGSGAASAGTGTGPLGGLSGSIGSFFGDVQSFFGGNTSQTGAARFFGTDSPGAGTLAGGAGGALIGLGIGSAGLFGGSTGETVGGALGGAAGSFFGPIGSLIGGILGSFVGSLFKKSPELHGGGSTGADQFSRKLAFNDSALGGFFLRGNHGAGEFRDQATAALKTFDKAIAGFLNDNQLSKVTEALKNWSIDLKGDALNIENILSGRFDVILKSFSGNVQEYVNQFSDLEDRTNALQKYVIALNGVSAAITGFIGSNPAQEIQDALNTPAKNSTETLTALGTALTDAFSGFDNTPEALDNITKLINERYQGELEFLKAIAVLVDGLTKSIEAQQQKIRDAVNGPAAPQTFDELIAQANGLLGSIGSATSPEQIAAIVASIQKLVDTAFTGLDPAGQAAQADFLIAFLDQVQEAATVQAQALADQVIAEGEIIRDQAAAFADAFAIPLDVNTQAVDGVTVAVNNQTDVLVGELQTGHAGQSEIVAAINNLSDRLDLVTVGQGR